MGGVERLCGLGISSFTRTRDAPRVSCRKCGPAGVRRDYYSMTEPIAEAV
jgi:hypothetical protein